MEGSETIFDRVRASARFVRDNAQDVKINHDAVAAFVKTLDPAEFESKAASRGYPLRFATLEEEVGFWGLLALLNFGSGFRVPLHQARNRGAFETIQRGLMGMYISGSTIDTQFLKEISLVQVGELFDIPLFEERDVYGGAIFMSAPGPLHPLGTMLQEVLNETGRTLEKEGCSKGLGEWVVRVVKGIPEGPHVAAQFVEKLATTLPGFADKATYKDKEVLILKKAQLLAADLYRHMRAKEPRFDFADIHDVTVFADNVLPAVLRKLGVLELSDSLSAKVDSNEDLPRGDGEVELRCVAIAACDAIVDTWKRERQAASEGVELNSMKLDFYLWAKGKEEGFRSIARHATKDTFYY